jgi:hypothetical protein
LLNVGLGGFRVTSADPLECLCRFNVETLWSDARYGVGCETVADRTNRVGETGLSDRRFLDLRRIEGPPGGNPLIENLGRLGIRFALGCKGGL